MILLVLRCQITRHRVLRFLRVHFRSGGDGSYLLSLFSSFRYRPSNIDSGSRSKSSELEMQESTRAGSIGPISRKDTAGPPES